MSAADGQPLVGQVVLVSGGAGGLGVSHAEHIVEAGGRVIVSDIDHDGALGVAARLGDAALGLHHDVTSPESWARVVAEAVRRFGTLTGLVNNAGIFGAGDTQTVSLADFRHVQAVNVDGTLLGIQAVVPALKAAGGGSIVNISSIAGLIGIEKFPAYVTSKFAVRGLTKAAALDLGRFHIRVNSVHPGRIVTPFIKDLDSQILPNQVVKEPGLPADVSHVVVHLLDPRSRFSTGSEFVVDGGRQLGEYRQ